VQTFSEFSTSIGSTGKQLLKELEDDPRREHAEKVIKEADRVIKLARSYQSYVKKQGWAPELLNLNDVLQCEETLLRNLAGEDLEIQYRPAPRLGLVMADRHEMIQVLTRLVGSGREAIPMVGTMTIETANVDLGPSRVRELPPGLEPGFYVLLTISVAGCGIRPERRTMALKTTIQRAGGYLDITTDPQVGNVFKVFLPRIESDPISSESSPAGSSKDDMSPQAPFSQGDLTGFTNARAG
jgi:signal transduction histidine kinase